VLAAKPANGFLAVAGVVGLGLLQSFRKPFEHLVIEAEPLEQIAEVFFEDFRPRIGFGASALVPGTVIASRDCFHLGNPLDCLSAGFWALVGAEGKSGTKRSAHRVRLLPPNSPNSVDQA
jgi:hypothetical protein